MLNPSTGQPTQQIVVAQVRAALEVTTMTAAAGGWRVIIIDPADSLNVNAANAILKTLEEPPAQTLFLLVSHAPGRLLPTIIALQASGFKATSRGSSLNFSDASAE